MIYAPTTGRMWDPSVLWYAGKYYMFAMHSEVKGRENMWVAVSDDGVHWGDGAQVFENPPGQVWKMFIHRCEDRFVLNHGSMSGLPGHHNDTLCFWESDDMLSWQYRGKQSDVTPDPRWYKIVGRCDHMYMIPKDESDHGKGYWGYVTATSAPSWPYFSIGMMESDDGRAWRWLPPPVFDWGNTPQQFMEVGGCEKIGGKYYLILGARYNYMGNSGYSMFTFVSDEPCGPFRPDLEAFRLCGNSHDLAEFGGTRGSIGVQTLGCFGRGKDGELLLTNYTPTLWGNAGEKIILTPLKKAVVDKGGHLRMGYWPGNEAMKGPQIPVKMSECARLQPAVLDEDHIVRGSGTRLELKDKKVPFQRGGGGGVVVLMANVFDLAKGVVLEGSMTVIDEGWGPETHIIPVTAGFYIEERPGEGLALSMETYGITRMDHMTCRDGKLGFRCLDVTGPGCATVGGLHAGRKTPFRVFVRHDLVEFYLDDLLVQTFFFSTEATGRLGFLVCDGGCLLEDVKAWEMSLDGGQAGSAACYDKNDVPEQ